MRKKIIITAASLIVVIGGGVAYVSYTDSQPAQAPAPVTSTDTTTPTSNAPTETPMISLDTTRNNEADGALKSALDPNVTIVNGEDSIVAIMHHMTHQKVEAEDKWTNVKMTPERVTMVRKIIETRGQEWKHKSELLAMATKWEAGDFSEIDKDHNFLWDLEGGNIGKAKGILSAADEQAFIAKTFN
jgi:hypothetical protein